MGVPCHPSVPGKQNYEEDHDECVVAEEEYDECLVAEEDHGTVCSSSGCVAFENIDLRAHDYPP